MHERWMDKYIRRMDECMKDGWMNTLVGWMNAYKMDG